MKHFKIRDADAAELLAAAIQKQMPEATSILERTADLTTLRDRIEGNEPLILDANPRQLNDAIRDTILSSDSQAEIYDLPSLIDQGAWSMFYEALASRHDGVS